jgi:ketosteroid isomerase-like protein
VTVPEFLLEFWRTWEGKGGDALVDRYDDFFTEDAEWRPPMRELTAPRYTGRDGIAQYVRDVGTVLKDLKSEVEEIEELTPDVFRVRVHMSGHGRVSGVDLDAEMIAIARIREGKIDLAWASYDPEAAERAEHAIVHGERIPA